MGVENPSGELAGGGVAEEFDVVSVVTELDEDAPVGRGVGVAAVVVTGVGVAAGGFGIVLMLGVLRTTGEGAEEQHGERGAEGGLHAVKLSGRGGMASGQW